MSEPIILLVEDNRDDEELTRLALEDSNVLNNLVVVHDGQEALEWIFCTGKYAERNPCVLPSLVLLDLKLPKIDGLEVLRQVRADERFRTLPVVVLTTSREERDVVESYHLGVNAYVVKPVAFREFMDAVKNLGLFWAVLNEPPPGSVRKAA